MFFFQKIIFSIFLFFSNFLFSQELDSDDLLDRINRLERNIVDLQKSNPDLDSNTPSAGYIFRNEKRFDEIETATQSNFGKFEVLENRIVEIEEKIDLLNADISIRFEEIKKIIKMNSDIKNDDESINQENFVESESEIKTEFKETVVDLDKAKKKYENAIKLLWADNLDEAMKELKDLKSMNPPELMPNIQYWLGEVFYEKRDFSRAVLEFGEGLERYPDSIKGPDNMLKLGLSFSNLEKKIEACNVFFELEVKYPSASKDVLQRALTERDKLKCAQD